MDEVKQYLATLKEADDAIVRCMLLVAEGKSYTAGFALGFMVYRMQQRIDYVQQWVKG